ncbi:acyltransferase family protein [Caulobacter sp. RL271]|uniref:Acyltransferase n=1 Tax=Caulobacter segnis TaxID=88688 RepID=A0ABY4ZNR9_9CAUL|nr:acyltransferase [Caulobacter segnis]USQ94195.1 acyltransferase [Caulobacter segnis]
MSQHLDLYSPLWAIGLFAIALATVRLIGQPKLFGLPVQPEAKRYGELDGLRGVLAFAVFLTHAASTFRFRVDGRWDWPPSTFYTMCGYVPVSLFFMITGFLFWRRAIDRKLEWRGFLVGRTFRIFPLYLASLAPLLLYVGIQTEWKLHEPVLALAKHLLQWTLLGAIGRPDINGAPQTWAINPAIWTLRAEAIFYLALPALAILATPRRFAFLAVVVLLAAVISGGVDGGGVWIHFLFGMLAAQIYSRFPALPALASPAAAMGCLATLLLLWIFRQHGYGLTHAAFTFPIFLCALYGNSFFGLLKMQSTRWLGEISYSIYVLHGIVLYGFFWALSRHTPIVDMHPLLYWASMIFVTVSLVFISTITFLKIEKPLMHVRSFPVIAPSPSPPRANKRG